MRAIHRILVAAEGTYGKALPAVLKAITRPGARRVLGTHRLTHPSMPTPSRLNKSAFLRDG